MTAPLPSFVVREFVSSMSNFFGSAPKALARAGKKRKVNEDLRRFCATCRKEADLALHPAPNVYCRNRACKQYGKKQAGGDPDVVREETVREEDVREAKDDPAAICNEATPEFLASLGEEPFAEKMMLRSLSAPSLSLLIEKYKTTIAELDTELDAIASRRAVTADRLHTAEQEAKFRTLDAMRAKVDITKPVRPTLIKLLSMLRTYGKLFDKHPVSKVKYDAEAVTCERSRGCYRERVEIMSDGKVIRDGILACNMVTDHPREWKL